MELSVDMPLGNVTTIGTAPERDFITLEEWDKWLNAIEGKEDKWDSLVERMGNLLDARLEQMLDTCFHCLVKLYDSKVVKVIDGKEMTFCCEHCMGAYASSSN